MKAPRRIIPAYAGSTMMPELLPLQRPDHPRLRGEHITDEWAGVILSGSSPPTRGAQSSLGGVTLATRIIPAYAGSTITLRSVP